MYRHPIDELRTIAHEFRHLRSERGDEGPAGSWRRRQEEQLTALEERFEAILDHWIEDDSARVEWRDHLHLGSPAPEQPMVSTPPAFSGRSEAATTLVICESEDGQFDVMLDGKIVDRYSASWRLGSSPTRQVRVGAQTFEEVFEAPRPALQALRRFATIPGKEPPWEWGWALFDDGLIDAHFGLTPRGRRFLASISH